MQRQMLVAVIALGMALQGCARAPTVLGESERQSLGSMALFGPDGSPHFAAYVACNSEDQSCATVNKVFSTWANDRGIALHLVNTMTQRSRVAFFRPAKARSSPIA